MSDDACRSCLQVELAHFQIASFKNGAFHQFEFEQGTPVLHQRIHEQILGFEKVRLNVEHLAALQQAQLQAVQGGIEQMLVETDRGSIALDAVPTAADFVHGSVEPVDDLGLNFADGNECFPLPQ